METSLRPLTLGEILDRTAQLYRSHFWLFAGIAAVNSGALLLLNLVQIGGQELLRAEHLLKYVLLLGALGAVVRILIWFVIGGIAVAANNRAVAWLHLGEPATIRGAYASILPRTGRYAWLMVIVTFKVWLPMFVVYVATIVGLVFFSRSGSGTALKNLGSPTAPQNVGLVLGVFFLLGLLFLACFVYAIFMLLRYSLAIAASVVEQLKARQAIRRSVQLTKGSRGRILLLYLLVIIIYLGLFAITQFFFIVLAMRHGQLSTTAQILQQLVAFVTDTFVGPIYATGFTLFYYDQRVRKEGYDIEWMMQAAGLSAAPAQELPAPEAAPQPPAADQAEHA